MQLARQPVVIAAVAAFVLLGNVAELASRPETGLGIDDGRGTAAVGLPGDEDSDGATGQSMTGDETADGGAFADGGDGSTGGSGEGGTSGEGVDGAAGSAGADGGTVVDDPQPVAALTAPASGTYVYDSSGSWQLTGDVPHTLPDTSEATVAVSGTGWTLRVAAGNDFVDSYGFDLGGDGMDWSDWSLDRVFFGTASTTVYTCSSEERFHTADNAKGRTVQHGCTGPQGLTSAGPVRTVGVESLTLSEGGAVETTHLRYEYEVGSPDCEGQGVLELWLDRTTGMRVQEIRSIRSTCTDPVAGTATTYEESVRFRLRSATPA